MHWQPSLLIHREVFFFLRVFHSAVFSLLLLHA